MAAYYEAHPEADPMSSRASRHITFQPNVETWLGADHLLVHNLLLSIGICLTFFPHLVHQWECFVNWCRIKTRSRFRDRQCFVLGSTVSNLDDEETSCCRLFKIDGGSGAYAGTKTWQSNIVFDIKLNLQCPCQFLGCSSLWGVGCCLETGGEVRKSVEWKTQTCFFLFFEK